MENRFPPISDVHLSPLQREMINACRSSWRSALIKPNGGLGGPRDALLRSPTYATAILQMSDYFRAQSKIPSDLKELVVLVIASARSCDFEWHGHVPRALKAGIPMDAIESIAAQKLPTSLTPTQRCVYEVVTEMMNTHRVSDANFSALSGAVSEEVLLDILGLAGHYWSICGILNVAMVPPESRLPADMPIPTS